MFIIHKRRNIYRAVIAVACWAGVRHQIVSSMKRRVAVVSRFRSAKESVWEFIFLFLKKNWIEILLGDMMHHSAAHSFDFEEFLKID